MSIKAPLVPDGDKPPNLLKPVAVSACTLLLVVAALYYACSVHRHQRADSEPPETPTAQPIKHRSGSLDDQVGNHGAVIRRPG